MVRFMILSLLVVLFLLLSLSILSWWSDTGDEITATQGQNGAIHSLRGDQNGETEQWIITESTWENEREFTYDWNGDGYAETLGTVFLSAGAQSHYDIVLSDGRSGDEIYRGYAFNGPSYGICTQGDDSPVIFIRVLGDLKAVLDSPLDSISYPAPPSEAATALTLCDSYDRLITYRDGSYIDVSGEYPRLLWLIMAETIRHASEDLGTYDDLTEIRIIELLD